MGDAGRLRGVCVAEVMSLDEDAWVMVRRCVVLVQSRQMLSPGCSTARSPVWVADICALFMRLPY